MKCYSVFLHKMYTEGDPLVFNVELFGMYSSFCWMYCKQCLLTFNKFIRIFHCFKLYSKERERKKERKRKKETCAVWHIFERMFFLLSFVFTGSGCGPDAYSCVLIYLHSVHVVVFLGTCNSDTYKKTFANAFTLFHNDINLYKNIFVINTAV